MPEVEYVPASQMFDIKGGAQPPKSEFISEPKEGYERFLQIRDFETDAHPTYIRSSPKWRRCEESDTLIGRYGAAVGRICRGLSGFYNVALVKVVPKSGVDPDYLHYLLRSSYFQVPLLAGSGRSAQAGFNKGDLDVIDLPFHDYHHQVEIGETLRTLDDKVELNRRMNETLEAQARALFRDWFVDFGPVKAKMAGDAPYLAPHLWSLFPDRLGEDGVPEGWHCGRLDEIVHLNPREKLTKGTDAPYLDMASLPTQGLSSDDPILRPFASGSKFRNGDALLARITPCLENGKAAFVDVLADEEVGWGSTEFIVMRAKPPVPAHVAYLFARDPEFRGAAIRSMSGTSGRQRASADALAGYPITVPTNDQPWARLGESLEPLFDKVCANVKESRTLAQTRDLLLPKLMSGEIRVSEAEKQLEDAL